MSPNQKLNQIEDCLLSSKAENSLSGQLVDGVVAHIRDKVQIMAAINMAVQRGKSPIAYLQQNLGACQQPFCSLVNRLDNVYAHSDACLQPGVLLAKITDVSTGDCLDVFQVKGRADQKIFDLSADDKKSLFSLNREGVDITMHYIQNLIAIDLDLRTADGEKVKLSSIANTYIKGAKKLSFENMIFQLLASDNSEVGRFNDKHLLALWSTEHGYRIIYRIAPVETASTTTTPFSSKIKKESPSFTQDFYRGLAENFLKDDIGAEIDLEDGQKIILDWDVGSTSSTFGLARLGKVRKNAKDGSQVDLTATHVIINRDSTPIDLWAEENKSKFKRDVQKSTFRGEEKVKVDLPPLQSFKTEDHKNDFATSLYTNFMSIELLNLYTKSPVMTYEAWWKILASFRRLKQTLVEIGSPLSQEVIQKAVDWSRATKGWDSKSMHTIENMLTDDHKAIFSAQSVHDSLGQKFFEWMQTPEAKGIIKTYKGWASQSIFSYALSKTQMKFQEVQKYDPRTGKATLLVGKPFLDDEGTPIQPKTMTPNLASKILEADPLLHKVLKFSVHAEKIIVAPNIQSVLEGAIDGVAVEVEPNLLTWSPLSDYHATTIRQYLDQVYKFKNCVKAEHLDDFFSKIKDPTGTRYDKYKAHLVADALKARYEEWQHFKSSGDEIDGTTDVLSHWLPKVLNINPNKSKTHAQTYKLYGAYGRKFLIGMVQRALATNAAATVENLLFLRGPAGAGKSRLVKQLMSSLFYGQDSHGGLGRVADFICEANEIPKDKDQVQRTFGSILLLLDDISTDILKKTEQGFLKSFMTASTDSLRLPYARETVYKNRTFATIATSNSLYLLSDLTSTRRNFIVDLDAVSLETGKYICELPEMGSIVPVERVAGEQNGGMISIQHHARLIALAFGEAYARGCLGEIDDSVETQEYHPLKGDIGMHDLTTTIMVERPYLKAEDESVSKDHLVQYQVANLGIEDSGRVLDDFLKGPEGLGSKTAFELHELKTYFRVRQEQVPGDSSIKLWASQGILAPNGERIKIISKRVQIDGQRRTLWTLQNEAGFRPAINPFFKQNTGGQWQRHDSYQPNNQYQSYNQQSNDQYRPSSWDSKVSDF